MKQEKKCRFNTALITVAVTMLSLVNISYSQQMTAVSDKGMDTLSNPIVSLSIGNKFVFDGAWGINGGVGSGRWLFTEEIIGDTAVNNVAYAVVRRHPSFASLRIPTNSIDSRDDTMMFRRCDGHKFYEYRPSLDSEFLLVDFDDSIGVEYPHYGPVISRQFEPVLNDTPLVIEVLVFYGGTYLHRDYASKFGFQGYFALGSGMQAITRLIGAVVDNVVYGDTTLFDSIQTGTKEVLTIPTTYNLFQNYPNPFNPSTEIRYDLSARARVVLKVFDMLGREVATLVDGIKEAGSHDVIWNAGRSASGVYFYRLQAGDFVRIRKMVVLR